MFAPPIANAQTKAAASSTIKLGHQRSTLVAQRPSHDPAEQVHMLQRTPGNQATLPLLSQQGLSLGGNELGGLHEQEADRIRMPDRQVALGMSGDFTNSALRTAPAPRQTLAASAPRYDFSRIPIFPPPERGTGCGAMEIPSASVQDDDAVEQPPGSGGSPAGGPTGGNAATSAAAAADSCDQPRSIDKTTSGGFLGGVSIDDYYPDLTGRGFYQHPFSGGTFDTGKRVGAVVQLSGVIPSPCLPSRFSLAQSVTRTRDRIDGVTDPTEGQTLDDIGKSGRNAARAPFRQDFLGGGRAPLGYLISMADPPSIGYGPTTNAEWDRDFVTSLVGPGGQQSVSWSVSIRVENGVVKRNTLS